MSGTELNRDSVNAGKKYSEYFFPAILTVMSSNIASIVDSIISGQILGGNAVAAISLFTPVTQIVFTITIFLGMGSSTIISKFLGKGQKKSADGTFTLSFLMMLFFGMIGAAVMLLLSGNMIELLRGSSALRDEIAGYYYPYAIGMPFNMALGCFLYFIRIDGRPKFTTAVVLVSNIVNLVMDMILMGVVKTGIMGASIATDIGICAALLLVVSHYVTKKNKLSFDFSVLKERKTVFSLIGEIFSTGFSGALNTLLTSAKMMFFNGFIMGLAAETGLMSFSLCNSSNIFVSMFISGATQAMMPLVGIFMGEKDYHNVRAVFRKALKNLLILSAAATVLVMAFPELIISLFGIGKDLNVAETSAALRFNAASFILNGIVCLFMYYFTALGKKALAAVIAISSNVAFAIPSALILSGIIGINGVWLSFSVTYALTLLLVYVITLIIRKKSGGKYGDVYLIEQYDEKELFAFSFAATNENASFIAEYLKKMLSPLCGKTAANRVAVASEEMTENIGKRAGGATHIDIRVIDSDESVTVIIRDSGKAGDVTKESSGEDMLISDIGLVRAVSQSVKYSNLMGFNRLIIYIAKSTEGE